MAQENQNAFCELQLINDCLAEFEQTANQKGVRLNTDIDDFWVIPPPTTEEELLTVFKGCLRNALAACEALSENREKCIAVYARSFPTWVMEISNPCSQRAHLDDFLSPHRMGRELRGWVAMLEERNMNVFCLRDKGKFYFKFFYMSPLRGRQMKEEGTNWEGHIVSTSKSV